MPVFEDGELLKEYSFGEIRKRAELPLVKLGRNKRSEVNTPLSSVMKRRVCGWFEDEGGGTPTKASPAHFIIDFNCCSVVVYKVQFTDYGVAQYSKPWLPNSNKIEVN